MIKHTQQQLLEIAETEPEKLNELAAIAQGWQLIDERPLQHFYEGAEENEKDATQKYYFRIHYNYYTPTTNKAQAWDLMVKAKLTMVFEEDVFVGFVGLRDFSPMKNPLIAVTIAFILAKHGDNNE